METESRKSTYFGVKMATECLFLAILKKYGIITKNKDVMKSFLTVYFFIFWESNCTKNEIKEMKRSDSMKKLTVCLLAAILSVCTGMQPVFAAVSTNAQPWAKAYVEKAYENGLATEDLLQKATSPVTRAEFCRSAMSLYERITGEEAVPSGENTFTDCDDPDVLAASDLKIISGMGDGTFHPDDPLTREQLCIILSRLLDVCGIELEDNGGGRSFTDISGLKETSQNYIHEISNAGFVSGYTDGTFLPHNSLKVEEALVVLLNVMEYAQQAEGTDSAETDSDAAEQTQPEENMEPEESKETEDTSKPVDDTALKDDVPSQDAVPEESGNIGTATVSVNGKMVFLDMSADKLKEIWGEPTYTDETVYGLDRFVYANEKNACLLATMENDRVISFFALSDTLEWNGAKIAQLPSQINADIRISSFSHSGIYEDDHVLVSFPMDYTGNICGINVTDLDFSEEDRLVSGTNLSLREDLAKELFAVINTLRVLEGEEPLIWEDALASSASDHSNDMVKQNYFDYNSLDGTTPFARIQKRAVSFHTASEVIANVRGDVPELFTELIKNTGKYNIITDETMTHAGIGVASSTKILYMTMDMCGFGE